MASQGRRDKRGRQPGCATGRAGEAGPGRLLPLAEVRIVVDGVSRTVLLDEAESPLGWLRRRRDREGRPLIDDVCFAAGERFRADLTAAMMLPRMGVDWDKLGGGGMASGGAGGPATATDAALAAKQRVDRAAAAVGRDFAGLLIDVCGFLKGLEAVEAERAWPARSAKLVLTLALRRLADHYGMAAEARGPARSSGIRSWGAPDARPSLAGAPGG